MTKAKEDIVLNRAVGETLAVIAWRDGATIDEIGEARQVSRIAANRCVLRLWSVGIVRPIAGITRSRVWCITSKGQEVFSALCKVYELEAA